MKSNIKSDKIVKRVYEVFRRYKIAILSCVILLVPGGFFFRVNSLVNVGRDENAYQAAIQDNPSPKINSKVLNKVESLQDSGAKNPGTEYDVSRTNPFAD